MIAAIDISVKIIIEKRRRGKREERGRGKGHATTTLREGPGAPRVLDLQYVI